MPDRPRTRTGRFRAALGHAFALAATVLCLGTPVPAQAVELRVASAYDPQSMDPHSLALLYQTRVVFMVYEGLVGRDRQFRLAPALATRWERSSPSTWRFHLRPDVRFHDGRPFTADDALFSLQRAQAAPSQRAFLLKGMRTVRKVDTLTIEIALAQPDAAFPDRLALVAMMSKAWCVAHDVEHSQDAQARRETWATRNANGTGAYRLDRYEPDTRTVLRAWPRWWGRAQAGLGNVDGATFVTIRSDATRLAALHSGEIDLVLDPPSQALDALARDPILQVTRADGNSTQMLAFDLHDDALPDVASVPTGQRNPLRDRRVREAVYRAINADLLLEKVLSGEGTVTGALFGPLMEGDVADLRARRRYDPVAARRLLAEAGWPAGFEVRFDCVNVASRERSCQAIAAMLAQVGIHARLQTSPGTRFFALITGGVPGLAEFGYTATTDAWQNLNALLHSWDGRGGGTFNSSRLADPRLDALIEAVRIEDDPIARSRTTGEALRLADEWVAYVPLYRPRHAWAMNRRVEPVMTADDTLPLQWCRVH